MPLLPGGVRQYVSLGAGFDTFALRQPDWAASLRIFEFDHPAMQAEKRVRLEGGGFVLPENCSPVATDFQEESLLECCQRGGVIPSQPTLFSWLGVSMYLERAEVESTLRAIAAFPPGSEVVLTFLQPGIANAAISGNSTLGERVANLGEPFKCCLDSDSLVSVCRQCGFSAVELLSPEEANVRYFQGRRPELPAPGRTSIACALV
jgi:methyltransferase (TIGR00027 family)